MHIACSAVKYLNTQDINDAIRPQVNSCIIGNDDPVYLRNRGIM